MLGVTYPVTREGCSPDVIDLIERIHAARHVLLITHPGVGAFAAIRRVAGEMPRPEGFSARWETAVLRWWALGGRTLDQINADRARYNGAPMPAHAWRPPERFNDGPAVQMPHHTASAVGMVGGGSPLRPGVFSLAHGGLLVMDEYPEFCRAAREALREPLDTGAIAMHRIRYQTSLPARFKLIARSNPCACGYWGHPDRACVCSPRVLARYRAPWAALLRRDDVTAIDLCGALATCKHGTRDAGAECLRCGTTDPADCVGGGR